MFFEIRTFIMLNRVRYELCKLPNVMTSYHRPTGREKLLSYFKSRILQSGVDGWYIRVHGKKRVVLAYH